MKKLFIKNVKYNFSKWVSHFETDRVSLLKKCAHSMHCKVKYNFSIYNFFYFEFLKSTLRSHNYGWFTYLELN